MKRILAIGAHPDDVELGCGGTLAAEAAKGAFVAIACLTSGEAGSKSVPAKELAAIREKEAKAAAEVLGAKRIDFLRFPDGALSVSREQKILLINLLREFRPDVLFVHASADVFPDHALYRGLVLAAIEGAAGPWYQESNGEPWRVPAIYGFEVWHPIAAPTVVTTVDASFSRKRDALLQHKSQVETVDYVGAAEGLARYRGALSGAGKYAEAFEAIRVPWTM